MTVAKYLYGKLTGFGIVVALATAVVDQAVKLWLLFGLDLGARGPVHLGPFIDLVLVWNTGISYGLFPQVGPLGQWALLGIKAVAVALLWVWLVPCDIAAHRAGARADHRRRDRQRDRPRRLRGGRRLRAFPHRHAQLDVPLVRV